MYKKVMYVFISCLILVSLGAFAGSGNEGGGIFEAIILFQNTPNPTADKTLIRTYLPESDPNASIRILASDSAMLVKEIPIGNLTGVNSVPLNVAGWANGKYIFELFYKGAVRDSHTLEVKH